MQVDLVRLSVDSFLLPIAHQVDPMEAVPVEVMEVPVDPMEAAI